MADRLPLDPADAFIRLVDVVVAADDPRHAALERFACRVDDDDLTALAELLRDALKLGVRRGHDVGLAAARATTPPAVAPPPLVTAGGLARCVEFLADLLGGLFWA